MGTLATVVLFDEQDLRQRGFDGFVAVADLASQTAAVPESAGVYAVVRASDDLPTFIDRSPASWFKGQDPTVPMERLRTEWVDGARTLYIGSAASLRERLELLVEFSQAGRAESVFHWGGRLLWQLGDAQRLRVAWREEPQGIGSVERDLVIEFRTTYGRLPFANLKLPPIRNNV